MKLCKIKHSYNSECINLFLNILLYYILKEDLWYIAIYRILSGYIQSETDFPFWKGKKSYLQGSSESQMFIIDAN